MLDFVKLHLLSLALGAIPVGALSFLAYQLLKRQSDAVDAIANPWVHRGAVFVINAVITWGFTFVGLAGAVVCTDGTNCLHELSQEKLGMLMTALLGALSSFLLHAKKDTVKDPTPTMR